MLNSHFFADADFLELLRFWETMRDGRALPDWDGDLGVIPRVLLPNLIISNRISGEPVYRYVGATCVRRFGRDPTGERAYADALRGAHARYLRSLSEETLTRRAPIFSAAIYQPDADLSDMLMTGRLHAPFTFQGSADPVVLMAVQLFRGSDTDLRRIGRSGVVQEVRRDLITDAAQLSARLAEAQRAFQLSAHTHQRTLVQDIEAVVTALTGGALLPLPCHEEPDPTPA